MKRNYLWAAFDKLSQLFIGLFITRLLAGYFGTDLFGAYQFSLSTFAVATSLTWLCPAELFYGRVDEHGRLNDTVITTSIVYRAALCLGIFVLGYAYVAAAVPDTAKITFTSILLLSLLYSEPLGIFRMLLETTGQYHLTSKVRFLGVATKVLVVCLTVKLELPPVVGAGAALVESFIISFLCLFLYQKNVAKYKFAVSDVGGSFLKEASLEGLKYWPGLVAMTFALKADRILLAPTMSPQQFGAYAAGMSLFEQFTTIGTSIVAVAGPVYIYRATENKIRSNFLISLLAMVAISVVGSAVLYALTPFIIYVVYGAKFAHAVQVFRTAILFAPLIFVELAASTLIVKNKMPWVFSFKWIAATAFCLIALQFGHGPMTGVYAHVLSWSVAVIVSAFYAVTYFKCIRLKEVEIGT